MRKEWLNEGTGWFAAGNMRTLPGMIGTGNPSWKGEYRHICMLGFDFVRRTVESV